MASGWYTKGIELWTGTAAHFLTGTYRIMAVKTGFAYDPDHDFVNDISANEMTGAARKTIGGASVTLSLANNNVVYDATDPTVYAALNDGTLLGFVIYRQVGGDDTTPADDELIWFIDVADLVTNGSDVTLAFHATGIGAIAVA